MEPHRSPAPVDVADARHALDAACRARNAARKPVPAPNWYVVTVVSLLALYVASTDAARALSAPWLMGIFGAVYALAVGIAIGLLYRRIGIVSFQGPYLAPTLGVVVACTAAGAGTYVACALASLPVRGVPAGAVAGGVLAIGITLVNRKVARDAQGWPG